MSRIVHACIWLPNKVRGRIDHVPILNYIIIQLAAPVKWAGTKAADGESLEPIREGHVVKMYVCIGKYVQVSDVIRLPQFEQTLLKKISVQTETFCL